VQTRLPAHRASAYVPGVANEDDPAWFRVLLLGLWGIAIGLLVWLLLVAA